jgi:hypothetical protein
LDRTNVIDVCLESVPWKCEDSLNAKQVPVELLAEHKWGVTKFNQVARLASLAGCGFFVKNLATAAQEILDETKRNLRNRRLDERAV